MATLNTQGISLYYELLGDPARPPVLLVSGLAGVGKSWGPQIRRFAEKYLVILPNQRGTGQTTHAENGYTTQQLAADLAAQIEHLALGPVHVVGSSTGGAIGQYLALNHPAILTAAELKRRERENLTAALARTGGKIFGPTGAAALLGMKPTTVISRLKALGLERNQSSGKRA